MKNSTNQGFDQDYNAQIAVDQASYFIVGESLSNHPSDQAEAQPTLESIPPAMGTPVAAALDNGYFSAANIELFRGRGIEPYIATGREPRPERSRRIGAGKSGLPSSQPRRRRMPARRRRWPTN